MYMEADTNFDSSQCVEQATEKFSFHTLSSILTFIFLPHFWCFSIPAIIFAWESKKLYQKNEIEWSLYFSKKAKKFMLTSWLATLFLAITLSLFAALILFFI